MAYYCQIDVLHVFFSIVFMLLLVLCSEPSRMDAVLAPADTAISHDSDSDAVLIGGHAVQLSGSHAPPHSSLDHSHSLSPEPMVKQRSRSMLGALPPLHPPQVATSVTFHPSEGSTNVQYTLRSVSVC